MPSAHLISILGSCSPCIRYCGGQLEIRTLRFDDKGTLYVAAVNGRATSGAAPSVPTDTGAGVGQGGDPSRAPVPSVSVSTEITAIGVVETPGTSGSATSRADNRLSKGAIYRIAPDGLWDQLWESKEDSPYDVATITVSYTHLTLPTNREV